MRRTRVCQACLCVAAGVAVWVAAWAQEDAPATASAPATQKAAAPAVIAHMRLSGAVLQSPSGFSLFADASQMTLRDWLTRLATARTDENVVAVALEIDSPQLTWSQTQELADAVRRLKEHKPVYAYVPSSGAAAYAVASAAGDVAMEPAGDLWLIGLASELTYFRGTLDKLGIEPQFVQVGRFKGAEEPFTRTGPSEEFRTQWDKLLDDMYDQMVSQIARQREIDAGRVREAIDNSPLSAPDARKFALTDRELTFANWKKTVTDKVSDAAGEVTWTDHYARKRSEMPDFSNPFAVLGMLFGGKPSRQVHGPAVAIIHADGMIMPGVSAESLFGQKLVGSRTIVQAFEQVRRDEQVKAVIFRVNSPGGSALASELIYQAARRCAKEKPVIASVTGMAASGGYYVAAGADTIVADPAAIVGSIGVVSGKLSLTGLYDKIGISTYEATRGRNAGMVLSRPWNKEELAAVRKHAQRWYDTFESRVAESRAGKLKDIDTVAQGRLFTARQAVRNGLVDSTGGLNDAAKLARSAAGIEQCTYITLPEPRTLMDVLYGTGGDASAPAILTRIAPLEQLAVRAGLSRAGNQGAAAGYLLSLAGLLDSENLAAALPYHVCLRR